MAVYIVNEPIRVDRTTGIADRMMDFTAAEEYGEIRHLLPTGTLVRDLNFVRDTMAENFKGFKPDDYLLLVGSPIAIAMAGLMAGRITNGRLNMLRWHSTTRRYQAVSVDTGPGQSDDLLWFAEGGR